MQITYAINSDATTGTTEEHSYSLPYEMNSVPKVFNLDTAISELKMAGKNGDLKYVNALSRCVHNHWKTNHKSFGHPATHGSNSDPGPNMYSEFHSPQNGSAPLWGPYIRIDSNDDIYDIKITSLSTDELYAISAWDSSGNDHVLVHRSTDGGWNWNVYWNLNLRSDYEVFYPGIRIVNDTIVMWYILHRKSDNTWRTWFRTCLPGGSDNCIYYGSPTSGFNSVKYGYLYLTDDSPIYGTNEYLYATWTETYGTGPDSTRVMFARSDEIDVNYWELGPTKLYSTSGANIYFAGSKIAYGSSSDMLWLTAWLHPNGYPSTFDRSIWGWYSTDYGATWSSESYITPLDNNRDEFDQVIAGSHSNTNWVILFTQVDTNFTSNRDIYYCYSTDDSTWIMDSWVSQHDEYLPDIWVDNASTGFYGTLRQDGSAFEYVQYKSGDINDPTSWTQPISIIGPWVNLSGIYGPSINRNMGNGDAIIAWTCVDESVYSIWFGSETWYGIADDAKQERSIRLVNLTPNPSNDNVKLSYVIKKTGNVKISVYDATGRLVNYIVNETKSAGGYAINFSNRNLSAGIYFVRVETADGITMKTMIVVK